MLFRHEDYSLVSVGLLCARFLYGEVMVVLFCVTSGMPPLNLYF